MRDKTLHLTVFKLYDNFCVCQKSVGVYIQHFRTVAVRLVNTGRNKIRSSTVHIIIGKSIILLVYRCDKP